MSGTKEGSAKAAKTNKAKYGEDFYKRIGSKGGSTKTDKPKGFAASGLAHVAGSLGGKVSKRGR